MFYKRVIKIYIVRYKNIFIQQFKQYIGNFIKGWRICNHGIIKYAQPPLLEAAAGARSILAVCYPYGR